MQYSVHAPTPFIRDRADQLLPGWSVPIASVLIVMQRSRVNLLQHTEATEAEKRRLRSRFLLFGCQVAQYLGEMGYVAEAFDPRTGQPFSSRPGSLQLDDVAIARSLLGYPTEQAGACSLICHPLWGEAVYPSTLIASAPPALTTLAADRADRAWQRGQMPAIVNRDSLKTNRSLVGALS